VGEEKKMGRGEAFRPKRSLRLVFPFLFPVFFLIFESKFESQIYGEFVLI
jgi:hypothetical protein